MKVDQTWLDISCLDNAQVTDTIKVPLHDPILSCGALRLPCTSANRNVWQVKRPRARPTARCLCTMTLY